MTNPSTLSYVRIKEAAEILGVSPDTVRRWEKKGVILSTRSKGGQRLFRVADLKQYQDSQPLTISEAASRIGLSTSSLRRLEKEGLITPDRNDNQERLYTQAMLNDLIVKRAQTKNRRRKNTRASNDSKTAESHSESTTNQLGTQHDSSVVNPTLVPPIPDQHQQPITQPIIALNPVKSLKKARMDDTKPTQESKNQPENEHSKADEATVIPIKKIPNATSSQSSRAPSRQHFNTAAREQVIPQERSDSPPERGGHTSGLTKSEKILSTRTADSSQPEVNATQQSFVNTPQATASASATTSTASAGSSNKTIIPASISTVTPNTSSEIKKSKGSPMPQPEQADTSLALDPASLDTAPKSRQDVQPIVLDKENNISSTKKRTADESRSKQPTVSESIARLKSVLAKKESLQRGNRVINIPPSKGANNHFTQDEPSGSFFAKTWIPAAAITAILLFLILVGAEILITRKQEQQVRSGTQLIASLEDIAENYEQLDSEPLFSDSVDTRQGRVLALTKDDFNQFFEVNIPAFFNDYVSIRNDFAVTGDGAFERNLDIADVLTVDGIDVGGSLKLISDNNTIDLGTGLLTAANVVNSIQGATGDLTLAAGEGIAINGLTISTDTSGVATTEDPLAFRNILVGSTTVSAEETNDQLTFAQGDNITISANQATDTITISSETIEDTFERTKFSLTGDSGEQTIKHNTSFKIAGGTGLTSDVSGDILSLNVGAGDGITVGTNTISLNLTSADSTATTASNSGLEVSNSGLRLLGGCSNGQTLAYNGASRQWFCATNLSVLGADTLDFDSFQDTLDLDAPTDINFTGNNLALDLDGTGDLLIQDTGTTFAAFTSDGRLGLGTDSPSALLDISGDALLDGTLTTSNLSVAGTTTLTGAITTDTSSIALSSFTDCAVLTTDATGVLTCSANATIADDSLDYAQFDDQLDLDANTTLSTGGLTYTIDLDTTGLFQVTGSQNITGSLDVTGSANVSGVLTSSSIDAIDLTATGALSVEGPTTINGVTYTWPSADGAANQSLTTDGAGVLTWNSIAGSIGDDALDFIKFEDILDLDDATELNLSEYNFTFDLDGTGDFIIQDNGTPFATFFDDGTIGFNTATVETGYRFQTVGDTNITGDVDITGDLNVSGTVNFSSITAGTISTTATQGSILFAGPGGQVTDDNANLFYNDSTNRVGIGTNTPNALLHVNGKATISDTLSAVELIAGGNIAATGTLETSGNITSEAAITAVNLTGTGNLSIDGTTILNGSTSLGSNTAAPGLILDVTGHTNLTGQLDLTGNLTASGSTSIEGATTLSTYTDCAALTTNSSGVLVCAAGGALSLSDADGDTTIKLEENTDDDTIRFDTAGSERVVIGADGTVSLTGALEVSDSTTINGLLQAGTDLITTGTIQALGSLETSGSISGQAISGTSITGTGALSVEDASTFSGALTVAGTTTLTGAITTDTSSIALSSFTDCAVLTTDATGVLTCSANATIADDSLDYAQFDDQLDLDANTTLSTGGLTYTIDLDTTGLFQVTGSQNITGSLDVTGSANVSGVLTSSSIDAIDLTATGALSVEGPTTINGVTYTWPSADGAANQSLTTDGAGVLTWNSIAGSIGDDALDFIKFEDILDLDDATELNLSEYNFTFDLDGTGDFIIQDNGTPFATFFDDGTIGFNTATVETGYRFQTVGDTNITGDVDITGDLNVSGTVNFSSITAGTISTTATQGSILFAGPGGQVTDDNANLFYNDSTNRVGIGTNTPNALLHVNGKATISDTLSAVELIAGGNIAATGTLETSGNITSEAAITAVNLTGTGNLSIDGTTILNGSTSLGSNTAAPGLILDVTGHTNLTGQLDLTGNLTASGSTSIEGATTLSTYTDCAALTTNSSGVLVCAAGGALSLSDADGDTTIKLEENTDDDTIRFDTAGSERVVIGADGTVSLTGALEVSDSTTINGLLQAGTDLITTGTIQALGSLETSGSISGQAISGTSITGTGALSVEDASTFSGALTVAGTTTLTGAITTDTSSIALSSFTDCAVLTTDATGVLTCSANATIADDSLDFAQFVDAMNLDANTTVNTGGLTYTIDLDTTGLFQVTGSQNITGSLDITGDLDVSGRSTLTGDIDTTFTQGSIVFAGINGELYQDNSGLFYDNLNNRIGIGTTTPNAPLDVNGNAIIDGSLTTSTIQANGNITGTGNLSIDGFTHLTNTVLQGDSSVVGTLEASEFETTGNITGSGNLSIDGTSILNGATAIGSNTVAPGLTLDITGDTNLTGSVDITGDLHVSGNTTFAGGLSCSDCLDFDSFDDQLDLDANTTISTGGQTLTLDLDTTGLFQVTGGQNITGSLDITGTQSITDTTTEGALFLNQDGNGIALRIDSESTTANIIDITTPTTTTANIIDVSADTLTTGSIADFTSNSADTSTRSLVNIVNDNAAAIGTTPVVVRQDAANRAVFIDQNGNGRGLYIDSETTSSASLGISANNTAGSIVEYRSESTVFTGNVLDIQSSEEDTGAFNFLSLTSDADGTPDTELTINQGGDITTDGSITASGSLSVDSGTYLSSTLTGTTVQIDHDATTGSAVAITSNSSEPLLYLHGGTAQITERDPRYLAGVNDDGTTELNGVENVAVVGRYAYLAGNDDNGVEIIDISDPANPVHVGAIDDTTCGCDLEGAIDIEVVGNYAYVTARVDDALTILDISDPTSPRQIGSITDDGTTELNGVLAVKVVGKYAYTVTNTEHAIEIIDISDPTNPTHVGSLDDTTCGCELENAKNLDVVGNYAYIASAVDDGIQVIDISDPANPRAVGSIDNTACGVNCDLDGANDIKVVGKYAYVAAKDDSALTVLDISDPTSPSHVASLDDTTCDTAVGGTGCELNGVEFIDIAGNYAYLGGDGDHGVEIVDISNPAAPVHAGAIDDTTCDTAVGGTGCELEDASGIAVVGKYAYVAAQEDDGLGILDISGLVAPAASIGAIASENLDVSETANIRDLYVHNGLNVGNRGAYIAGTLAATAFNITGVQNADIAVIQASNTAFSNDILDLRANEEQSGSFNFLVMNSDSDGTPDLEFRFADNGAATADVSFSGGGADVAEYFAADQQDIPKGTLITLGNNAGQVSVAEADQPLVGVVSTQPGLIANTGGAEGLHVDNPDFTLVGLLGQVPTRVNLENGPISIGDGITTSSVPGVGRKANPGEPIVGVAMVGLFDMSDDESLITVYVNTNGNNTADLATVITEHDNAIQGIASIIGADLDSFQIEQDDTQTIQQSILTRLDALETTISSLSTSLSDTSTTLTGAVHGSSDDLTAVAEESQEENTNPAETLVFANTLSLQSGADIFGTLIIHENAVVHGTLLADSLSVANAFIVNGNATFFADVTIQGNLDAKGELTIGENQAGTATIPRGGNQVKVIFEEPFLNQPLVQVTPLTQSADFWISNQQSTGFIINLPSLAEQDTVFNWQTLTTFRPIDTVGQAIDTDQDGIFDIDEAEGQIEVPNEQKASAAAESSQDSVAEGEASVEATPAPTPSTIPPSPIVNPVTSPSPVSTVTPALLPDSTITATESIDANDTESTEPDSQILSESDVPTETGTTTPNESLPSTSANENHVSLLQIPTL